VSEAGRPVASRDLPDERASTAGKTYGQEEWHRRTSSASVDPDRPDLAPTSREDAARSHRGRGGRLGVATHAG